MKRIEKRKRITRKGVKVVTKHTKPVVRKELHGEGEE